MTSEHEEAPLSLSVDAGFRAFMLRFRHEIGRPLDESEHLLAQLAYQAGFADAAEQVFQRLAGMSVYSAELS